jgi:hypothetical protein
MMMEGGRGGKQRGQGRATYWTKTGAWAGGAGVRGSPGPAATEGLQVMQGTGGKKKKGERTEGKRIPKRSTRSYIVISLFFPHPHYPSHILL